VKIYIENKLKNKSKGKKTKGKTKNNKEEKWVGGSLGLHHGLGGN
jgi:hypothetical protein